MREIDWSVREERYTHLYHRYRRMAELVEAGDEHGISWVTKAIPRGRTPEWYRAKADDYLEKAAECQERTSAQRQVDDMTRLMAMPPAEREAHEAVKVSVLLGMTRAHLADLPLQPYLAVIMALIEDAKQRCADEGVAWPPMG